MSVYSQTRGDTQAVRLVVMNTYDTYKALMPIISRVTWWDDDDSTWNDIDKAAKDYRAMVEMIPRNADGMTDLIGVDYDRVDWFQLIRDELYEVNLKEGRKGDAGL